MISLLWRFQTHRHEWLAHQFEDDETFDWSGHLDDVMEYLYSADDEDNSV